MKSSYHLAKLYPEFGMFFVLFLILFYSMKAIWRFLKGYWTSNPQKAPELAYFVLFLKIVNIFLKNYICIL